MEKHVWSDGWQPPSELERCRNQFIVSTAPTFVFTGSLVFGILLKGFTLVSLLFSGDGFDLLVTTWLISIAICSAILSMYLLARYLDMALGDLLRIRSLRKRRADLLYRIESDRAAAPYRSLPSPASFELGPDVIPASRRDVERLVAIDTDIARLEARRFSP